MRIKNKMTVKEYVDGIEVNFMSRRDAGINKLSENNRNEIFRLELLQRKSRSNKAIKFTKEDQEKLHVLYKMAEFIA